MYTFSVQSLSPGLCRFLDDSLFRPVSLVGWILSSGSTDRVEGLVARTRWVHGANLRQLLHKLSKRKHFLPSVEQPRTRVATVLLSTWSYLTLKICKERMNSEWNWCPNWETTWRYFLHFQAEPVSSWIFAGTCLVHTRAFVLEKAVLYLSLGIVRWINSSHLGNILLDEH